MVMGAIFSPEWRFQVSPGVFLGFLCTSSSRQNIVNFKFVFTFGALIQKMDDKKQLTAAELQLEALLRFSGEQLDDRVHDVAIRLSTKEKLMCINPRKQMTKTRHSRIGHPIRNIL